MTKLTITVLLAGLLVGPSTIHAQSGDAAAWDAGAAAAYLDQRVDWWSGWETAARERGTFCVSCHTTGPYGLARPLLRLPDLRSVATDLPMDWIVLETDAHPQPFKKDRRRWTEPRHVAEIAAALAKLKEMSLAEVAEATTSNALTMLGRRGALIADQVRGRRPASPA